MASARASTSRLQLDCTRAGRLERMLVRAPARRCFSIGAPSRGATQPVLQEEGTISERIRALMRSSAQPVALVTTLLPPTGTQTHVHAATLSSFSSVSLDPNLVCFSMRTPSKLAAALEHHVAKRTSEREVDLVVNVLTHSQAGVAAAYAKPGTPPLPYPIPGHVEHPLQKVGLVQLEAAPQGPPALDKALGALACQVVDAIPLAKYAETPPAQSESSSVLYIARVLHVHLTDTAPSAQPLVYHHQQFVSTTAAR